MKRAAVTAVFLCAVAALGGCPIYSHEDDGCFRDRDCGPGYACDDNSGECYVPNDNSCSRPRDCAQGQTCGKTGQCASGDCSFNGCVSGYRCESSTGIWQCVSNSSAGAAGANGGDSSAAGVVDNAASAGDSAGGAAGQASGG